MVPNSPERRSARKGILAAIFILLVLMLVGGAVYAWLRYSPWGSLNPAALPPKEITLEVKSTYELYRPDSFEKADVKRLVLVLPPGEGDEDMTYLRYWARVADQNGYLLAAVPDWTGEKIASFLQGVRTAEGVERVYTTGFSNGGYMSCTAGLTMPDLVDGMIPMAAFCMASEAVSEGAKAKPIYNIIGSKDSWALGDDGRLAEEMSQGLNIEFNIVPGLGHAFPHSEMGKVAAWINAHWR